MIVVGGTYTEVCFEPIWENIYGSGFRAVSLILQNSNQKIDFYTCGDSEVKNHLNYYRNLNSNLSLNILDVFKSPEFHYDHPLKTPTITPRPDLYDANNCIEAKGDNILAYGMMESSIQVHGKKIVYDPQSPVNPIPFSETGSTVEQLITIVNLGEAKKLSGRNTLIDIKDFFFNDEKCYALIIKMGAKGAYLYESKESESIKIPVYETDYVWTIGSGDVFSAYFALNWFNGKDLKSCAILASKSTALYCNSKDLSIKDSLNAFSFKELLVEDIPTGQIYLAGPFFTFTERWLVNEIWNVFKNFGLKVFSPFHDVGHGLAKDVVDKDIEGIDKSEIIFAIIDGLDSGTLFEVGYAICQKKRVIAFVQNEDEESLKMLEGTNCIIEKDLTTAIYKLYWTLAKQ